MGGTLSKKMESVMRENMKENQEFMLAAQRMQVGPIMKEHVHICPLLFGSCFTR